jgi:environmental stress-induced protein Ves
MPWKNGGGETAEIAVSPSSAQLDAMDWRISMAGVAVDGPFSIFPGIDRTLCILEGDGLRLCVAGEPAVSLTSISEPFGFPADAPTYASLIGGPVADLNVMTRRGRYAHHVRRVHVAGTARISTEADVIALFCHAGHARLVTANGKAAIGPLDSVIDTAAAGSWVLTADDEALVLVVEITALRQ